MARGIYCHARAIHFPIALSTIKQTENLPSTHALRFLLGSDPYLLINLKDSYPRQAGYEEGGLDEHSSRNNRCGSICISYDTEILKYISHGYSASDEFQSRR